MNKTDSNTPLVSIITCFLNEEKFLKEAIESVLLQEYLYWELILVDDGSTDSSTQIAKEYAAKYPGKIYYLNHNGHQNIGASASRNVAIEIAKGELVTFLDGDDVWLPQLLSNLVKMLQDNNVAMVCEASKYWYSWENKGQHPDEILYVGTKQDCIKLPPQLIFDLYPLGKGYAPCICGILIKKDIIKKHGGFDEYFKGMYDDQALLIKIYLHETVYISSTYNNLYRQRKGSLVESSHASGKYLEERKRFLIWLKAYIKKSGIRDKMLNRYLNRALNPLLYPKIYYIHKVLNNRLKKIKNLIIKS